MGDFISIITVNYNGKRFLKDFLNSTRLLNYPKEKYEVILVDNASTDGSVAYIKRYFPEVKIIKAKINMGFGAGNNLGIKNAIGELFFLVNNDTVLEKNSLKEIVTCFLKWSKVKRIGAINAKLVLFDQYLPFILKEATFAKYQVPKEYLPKNENPYVVLHGRDKEPWEEIYVPISYSLSDDFAITIFIRKTASKEFKLFLGSKLLANGRFGAKDNFKRLSFKLDRKQIESLKLNLIQNAGNILFRDGFGRDRGAEIINYNQYYEPDRGQYEETEPVPMFCGAGVLLNKRALEAVGLFDERFFMYYEDGDLSLRFKKAGWEIVYCPKAIVRHIHAGSSKEWSPFFIFQVEKNRLLFVSKHWPRFFALKEWLKYFLRYVLGGFFYYLLKGQEKDDLEKLKIRLKVILSLASPFLIGLLQRRRLSYSQIKQYL